MRLAEVAAAAGAITALIAGTAMFDEFGPGALLAAVGGLAVLVAASLAAQRLRRTVRYRIDRPNSTAWLTGKVAALLAGLVGAVAIASAVDAPSLPRTVIVVVVVGALAGVVNAHAARWTLFQVDATGLRLGRAAVPWAAVARLDLAGAAPGAVEIGVQLVPGQVVDGSPTPGTVLADLPVCTLVPAAAVHVDRVRWAVGEFGDPAIPVVVREQVGYPTPPIPATPPNGTPAAIATPPGGSPAPAATHLPASGLAIPAALPATPPEHPATPPSGTPAAATAPPATPPASGPAIPAATPPNGTPAAAPPAFPYPPMPAPPPLPPPRKLRREWVVGGVLALATVLVAGVTVVLVNQADEPGRPEAAAERAPRYSAAGVEEPCDLIDVYVLKQWSTVKQIDTEPSRDTHPDYDWLHCGAHSASEYLVGRVTHLELVIAVAEDARAARDFHAEQEERGLWVVSGDVREQGNVQGLGESAEFEQAISTYGDHTRADYVLRLRDDNLSLFLKFGSDADQSDGAGVTVSTLADAAATQARSAMEKLRARPTKKEKKTSSAVPKAMHEAVTLPSTEDLMTRIRGADPCELLDRDAMSEYGTVEVEPHQALGLAECRLMAVSGGTRVGFGLRLNGYLSEEERADLVREELDGQEVFHSEPDPGSNGCAYHVPYGNTGFGAELSVRRYVPGAEEQGPWPEACEAARNLTARVAPAVVELPARSTPAPEPTLVGKDPCVVDEVAASLPDWKVGPVGRYQSAQCRFTITQGQDKIEFDVNFDRDAEQLGEAPANVGGLTGVWFNAYEGQCGLSLIYVPESAPDAWDAQNIGVSVQYQGGYGSPSPLDLCELAQSTAQTMIDGL